MGLKLDELVFLGNVILRKLRFKLLLRFFDCTYIFYKLIV